MSVAHRFRWHDHSPLPREADIVIVGGGLAGLQLAKDLELAGHRDVVVLEAGPGDDVAHVNLVHPPDEALRLWLEAGADRHFWRPWISQSTPHYDLTSGLRRRLGGRSLYWHGVILPIESWALKAPWWPESVVRDLVESWGAGPSLYDRVRAEIAAWLSQKAPSRRSSSPLVVGRLRLAPAPRAVYAEHGNRWAAYTAAEHWTDGANVDGGVRFVTAARAIALRTEAGKCTAVRFTSGPGGDDREIACRIAVLAAGTIENTRLSIQALDAGGAPGVRRFPGLVDHIVQGFAAFFDPDVVPVYLRALASEDALFHAPIAGARSNLFVRIYLNAANAFVLDAWTMGEQLPSDATSVTCRRQGEWPWPTFVKAGLSNEDREVVRGGQQALQDLWADFSDLLGRSATQLDLPDFEAPRCMLEHVLPRLDSARSDQPPLAWASPLGSEYHEGCTLPLGKVLGEDQQFVDLSGLYAVGPSIFPRMGAANPSLTSLALSKRLAGLLSAQRGGRT